MDLDGYRRPHAPVDHILDGRRELDDARRMLHDLAERCLNKPLFVSDELPHYATVLGELFHKLVPAPATGKPGRPRKPRRVIDADLGYATVHKSRQGAQVVKVERQVVYGSDQHILQRLEELCAKNTPQKCASVSQAFFCTG